MKKMNKRGQVASATGSEQIATITTSQEVAKIKKFGVLRMASFMGLYGIFTGIIFDIVVLVLSILLPILLPTISLVTASYTSGSFFTGTLAFLIYPISIGVISFIGGLIFIPLMNLALKITKGISLTIEA